MKGLIEWMNEDFASTFGKKNAWVKIPESVLRKDKELLSNIFDLLQLSYAYIGGHANYKKPEDILGDGLTFYANDLDADPDADAFVADKVKPSGAKGVVSGTDGGQAAKTELVRWRAERMKKRGVYAEMSGAAAHVMLKAGVPAVQSKATVEKVLEKKVEWIGAHPDGKYPGIDGWYKRTIGGDVHMKIMLGIPNTATKAKAKTTAKATVRA
jgi:hypothetical protein